MADVKINVPPANSPAKLKVGDSLYIHVAKACNFCCSIGDNFSPSIKSLPNLSSGDHGPYYAQSDATGKYNSSDLDKQCNPGDARQNSQSIQIIP